MLPVGHASVGYLVAAVPALVRGYDPPRGWELVALLIGTQLPDLIDKPLAYAGVVPSGRSVAHSALVAVPLLVALSRYRPRHLTSRSGAFFSVGYLTHLAADSYGPVLGGTWAELRFLLWPALPAIAYPGDTVPPWERLVRAYVPPELRPGTVLFALALVVWYYHKRNRDDTGSSRR